MPVTLRDVAARAGVSPIVVSRVLHNKALTVRVSKATAERVRTAALELDYRLNVSAKNFRNQQTRTIGVLHGLAYPSMRFDDRGGYLSSLMQGFVEGAFANDYSVTLCPKLTGTDPIEAMCDGRFDGLVWHSTTQTSTYYKIIESCTVPLVVVHGTPEDVNSSRSTVICDNYLGIGLAVDHLVSLGHTRFLYVTSGAHNPENYTRLRALQDHLAIRSLRFESADILDLSDGMEPAVEYFSMPLRHTAAICYVDHTAGQLVTLAQQCGIRIPKDLSVIGFDSTPYCDEFRPRITSVKQPIAEIGRLAIDILVGEMQQHGIPLRNEIVPCALDVRESTGPVFES